VTVIRFFSKVPSAMKYWIILLLWTALVTLPVGIVHATDVIAGDEVIELEQTLPDVDDLWVTADDFTGINGFVIKPEGACYKDQCIPIRRDAGSELYTRRDRQDWFNASAFAEKIEQAFVVDRDNDVWSFGLVPSARKPFLQSAIAPDFALTDRDGDLIRLSDFHGKKVLIITWASW